MHFIRIISVFICLSILSSCSSDESIQRFTNESDYSLAIYKNFSEAEQIHFSREVIKDFHYGKSDQQICDIYLPEGRSTKKTKVLVLLHGGGWINGDKKGMEKYIKQILNRNPDHAIVNMNYTLADQDTYAFPNQFNDIELLLKVLKKNQKKLQIAPEFGLIGASAGAHIALMYDYFYDKRNQVKFVCSMVGPTDLTDPFYQNRPDFEELLNLLVDKSVYPNISENLEVLSPAYQIDKKSSPTIMFYGLDDPIVPIDNAYVLKKELTDHHIDKSFHVYNGGHNNWTQEDYENLHNELSLFIDEHLPIH